MKVHRVLFDTNVVLDDLLDRQPFSSDASKLTAAVERGEINGILCATTLTTIYYFASRELGDAQARAHIATLLRLFEIAPVDIDILSDAFALDFTDYEDAVLHEAARRAQADSIVTRNERDFQNASLGIWTPNGLLETLLYDE